MTVRKDKEEQTNMKEDDVSLLMSLWFILVLSGLVRWLVCVQWFLGLSIWI